MTLSGPLFEPSETEHWVSSLRKQGAHYNIYHLRHHDLGMAALREIFEHDKCDALNFLLLGTSGVHGSYASLDDIEASVKKYGFGEPPEDDAHDDWCWPSVTFVVVHSRLVCLRYGNVRVYSQDDLDWLRKVASTTPAAVSEVLAGSVIQP